MRRRHFLASLFQASAALGLGLGASSCAERGGGRKPHIVLIMCDDLGYGDVGFTGTTGYATPHIDRIAREGMTFDQCYSAAPVCSPTRVALMTARYPAREEVGLHEPLTSHPTGLSPEPPTLPRLLKDGGYRTALVGKWHLGTLPPFHPMEHGLDEFYGFLGAAADYHTKEDTEQHRVLFHDGRTPVTPEGYLTDLFSERAVRIITRHAAEHDDQPLFLSLQYNAPHWPWQAPEDVVRPDTLDWRGGGTPARFAAMMTSLDEGIGRVLDALELAGMADDTLLVFTSDNGGERFSHMGPLSHAKMTVGEGGIRVATAARWPARIAAGTRSDQVAVTMDWSVTFAALAGTAFTRPVDGIDLLPTLIAAAPPQPRTLFWRVTQRRRQKAVRHGDLKYVVNEDGEFLYDLGADVAERRDLRFERSADAVELKRILETWEAEVLPPVALDPRLR